MQSFHECFTFHTEAHGGAVCPESYVGFTGDLVGEAHQGVWIGVGFAHEGVEYMPSQGAFMELFFDFYFVNEVDIGAYWYVG